MASIDMHRLAQQIQQGVHDAVGEALQDLHRAMVDSGLIANPDRDVEAGDDGKVNVAPFNAEARCVPASPEDRLEEAKQHVMDAMRYDTSDTAVDEAFTEFGEAYVLFQDTKIDRPQAERDLYDVRLQVIRSAGRVILNGTDSERLDAALQAYVDTYNAHKKYELINQLRGSGVSRERAKLDIEAAARRVFNQGNS